MRSIKVLSMVAVATLLLGGCEGYKFVGTNVCNTDGASVWWIKPNSQGRTDTANVNEANCVVKK